MEKTGSLWSGTIEKVISYSWDLLITSHSVHVRMLMLQGPYVDGVKTVINQDSQGDEYQHSR